MASLSPHRDAAETAFGVSCRMLSDLGLIVVVPEPGVPLVSPRKTHMVHIDVADDGREPARDLTTRIRKMSAEINRALATAKPEATVEQLTNRICRIIRRHGLDPNRPTIRRRVQAQLAMRTELSGADATTSEQPPPSIPRQPVFADLPALDPQPLVESRPTFAPLPPLNQGDS